MLTVRTVGIQTILTNIAHMRWQLFPILAVYLFIYLFHALGWYYSFPRDLPKQVPFLDLFQIRIVGETLNDIVPWAASLGGEPIKAELLKTRHKIPLSEGFASILIVHTTFWISLNVFIIGSVAFNYQSTPLTPVLWRAIFIFLFSLGIGAILLILGLKYGIFRQVHSLGENFKWWGSESHERKSKFLALDEEIKKFYSRDRQRFFLSTVYNFLGWFTGTLEVFLIAKVIGLPINFVQAWLIEALIQVIRIATFFVPASIGTQEGGIVLIFLQLGFNSTLGVTFALIRRIREIIWIGIGLLLWALMEDKPRLRSIHQ